MLVSIGTDVVGRAWWYRGVSEPGLPWRVARGLESRAEYLRRTVLGYEGVEHIGVTAPRARVFSPSFRDHLYQETLMDGGPTTVLPIRQALDRAARAETPGESWRHMRAMGYEYFLADGRNQRFNGSWVPRSRLYRPELLSEYARLVFVGNVAYVFRFRPAPGEQTCSPVCSGEMRHRASRRECEHCGQHFQARLRRRLRFCSRECAFAHDHERALRERVETAALNLFRSVRYCRVCGCTFTSERDAALCGEECRRRFWYADYIVSRLKLKMVKIRAPAPI
jgi:hypothetical protein